MLPGDIPGRPRAMFQDGNRIRFERTVDEAGQAWWLAAFHGPFGLTPEDMADLLTSSIDTPKSIIYRSIDGERHAFSLRVEGRLQDAGEVWFVERSLQLEGAAFSADQMFIPAGDAQQGRGRRLMGDLIRTGELLGVARITIEAERIGRYAWLQAGFVPDRGSWRNIQLEALRFLQRQQRDLGASLAQLIAMVAAGDATTARWLANLRHPVPSHELFHRDGTPRVVPLGKAFFIEASPDWTGEFNFDPDSLRLARDYISDHIAGGGAADGQ